jgi:hypothetical protein
MYVLVNWPPTGVHQLVDSQLYMGRGKKDQHLLEDHLLRYRFLIATFFLPIHPSQTPPWSCPSWDEFLIDREIQRPTCFRPYHCLPWELQSKIWELDQMFPLVLPPL